MKHFFNQKQTAGTCAAFSFKIHANQLRKFLWLILIGFSLAASYQLNAQSWVDGNYKRTADDDRDLLLINRDALASHAGISLYSRFGGSANHWQIRNDMTKGNLEFTNWSGGWAEFGTKKMTIDRTGNVINYRTFVSGKSDTDYAWPNGKMNHADTRGFYTRGDNIWAFFGRWNIHNPSNNHWENRNVIAFGNSHNTAGLWFYSMKDQASGGETALMNLTANGLLAIGHSTGHLLSDKLAVAGVSTFQGKTFQTDDAWFEDNVRIGTTGNRTQVMAGAEKLIVKGSTKLDGVTKQQGKSYHYNDSWFRDKVSIGTTTNNEFSHSEKFRVQGGTSRFTGAVNMDKNLLIGPDNGINIAGYKLLVNGPAHVSGFSNFLGSVTMNTSLTVGSEPNGGIGADKLYVNGSATFESSVNFKGGLSTLLKATKGIEVGTSNSSKNIKVYGVAQVKDLYIDPNGSWSDYVFEPDYELRSLAEVKSFIKDNGHLPDVPSAKVVAEKGYAQTDVNATLLLKIEELTLYMIQMKEENEQLKSELNTLKSRIGN